MQHKPKIAIIDVTNRDGVQTAQLGLAKIEKTIVNLLLNELGVCESEMGFPTTKHETNYINTNLELAEIGVLSPIVLRGWVRAAADDVTLAMRLTKIQNLNLSISTSEQMTRGKFGGRKTREGIHADGVLKERRNYELYDFEELGRGEPEIIETGRQIVVGEYSGIKGFRNVYHGLEIEFDSDDEAREILDLVRLANVLKQKPLVDLELRFIAQYPEQTRKLLTVTP